MPSFDPTTVREAVATFTPRRPPRFHALTLAKDVIAELRQKRASYRAIADLLSQHCLPVSKTAVAAFCHLVLGENVRARRRPNRRSAGEKAIPKSIPAPQETNPKPYVSTHPVSNELNTTEPAQPRSRGPRIAQVRLAQPPQS